MGKRSTKGGNDVPKIPREVCVAEPWGESGSPGSQTSVLTTRSTCVMPLDLVILMSYRAMLTQSHGGILQLGTAVIVPSWDRHTAMKGSMYSFASQGTQVPSFVFFHNQDTHCCIVSSCRFSLVAFHWHLSQSAEASIVRQAIHNTHITRQGNKHMLPPAWKEHVWGMSLSGDLP